MHRVRKRKERFGDVKKAAGEVSATPAVVDPELAEKLAKRAKRFATDNQQN
jgi:hypothetical protein